MNSCRRVRFRILSGDDDGDGGCIDRMHTRPQPHTVVLYKLGWELAKDDLGTYWSIVTPTSAPVPFQTFHHVHTLRTVQYLVDPMNFIYGNFLTGKKECVLLAHDWGGAVGWQFAYKYPQMVSKFVPMNCPHPAAFEAIIRSEFSQFVNSGYFFFQILFNVYLHQRCAVVVQIY